MFDAAWSYESSFEIDFKKIAIDIYSPSPASIDACPREQGIKHLVRGIKYFAIKSDKKDYFMKEPEVADSIFRVK